MIQDVKVIPLVTREDDRGYLTEIARTSHGQNIEDHSVVGEFGQVYIVGDPQPYIIRAFHKHFEMWDWYFCPAGSMKVVLRDDREDSTTYQEMMIIILSMRSPRLVAIPPGVWHGWMSLEIDTMLISLTSKPYNRYNPDEERINAFEFGDVWEVKPR